MPNSRLYSEKPMAQKPIAQEVCPFLHRVRVNILHDCSPNTACPQVRLAETRKIMNAYERKHLVTRYSSLCPIQNESGNEHPVPHKSMSLTMSNTRHAMAACLFYIYFFDTRDMILFEVHLSPIV